MPITERQVGGQCAHWIMNGYEHSHTRVEVGYGGVDLRDQWCAVTDLTTNTPG